MAGARGYKHCYDCQGHFLKKDIWSLTEQSWLTFLEI